MDKKVESDQLQIAIARVTANGIVLFDKHYSNEQMLRFRWFEHAERNGDWDIPVAYHPSEPDYIFLFDYHGVEVATSLESPPPMDPEVKDAYFKAIQNLKEQLFRYKPRK